MTELEKLLLKKVEQLSKENERLQETIDKLHADIFYYQNHRQPIPEPEDDDPFPFK